MVAPETLNRVVIRFAGDSGDGMQLTGDRFTSDTALLGNDFATLPAYPAEIRAPKGTVAGVSSFQIHFASDDIKTPGDRPDVLVAMNPAALRANIEELSPGGILLADAGEFTKRNLAKVHYASDPLTDGSLSDYKVVALDLTDLAIGAVQEFELNRADAARTKNMLALGLLTWMFSRPVEPTLDFLSAKFAKKPVIRDANAAAFKAGFALGETLEGIGVRYEVEAAPQVPGDYRQISGNKAIALGLAAAAERAGLELFQGAYPITPATDILAELAHFKDHGVITYQAEDEIAAIGAAIGASYAGKLGVTSTSGPGMSLKAEFLGLAVMLELPLVVVDVQRAGPSTGMPTRTEQSDLNLALYGRHGEAPLPVLAPKSPADCFEMAFQAARIAIERRTPVILLSDAYVANGSEPWRVPDLASMPRIDPKFASYDDIEDGPFLPYSRDENFARPWAIPGTPGLEHRIGGLEKSDGVGSVSHAPANHERMTKLRAAKVDAVAVPPLTVEDPDGADLLVVGWGSTWGPIAAAVRDLREQGRSVAVTHLQYLHPLPANTGKTLRSYKHVVVAEMNTGQLARELRANYLVDAQTYSWVRGLPISPSALAEHLDGLLNAEHLDELLHEETK